jgi:hypothetical protein
MPVQPLTLRQEQSAAAQCQNGDRFIPHRCQIKRQGFHCTKILAETSKEEDILKQVMRCNLDVNWHYQYFITTQYPLLKLVVIQKSFLLNMHKRTREN